VSRSDPRPAASAMSVSALGREFVLRFTGAALQVGATWAVVHRLEPTSACIYFEGFVLAYGLSALLRGKYEIYFAHYLISESAPDFGISEWTLLWALARRTLIRGALACAALLVLTTDLDIQEPQLRPYLETFLPFMLAIPFSTLAMLLAGALRAANRTLGSILISTYALNLTLIAAALFAPAEHILLILSWAFCVGTLLAAGIGTLIVRRVLRGREKPLTPRASAWRDVYTGVASHGITGVALTSLQWGPLCVLAVVGPALQIAEYAVVARTAQVVEIMLPVMLFAPGCHTLQPSFAQGLHGEFMRLLANLGVALAAASTWVALLLVAAPWLLSLFGPPYAMLGALLTVLLCMQWINGAGRPAIRFLSASWHPRRIRNALCISAGVAILISLLATRRHGAYAAAAATSAGVLLINGQAIFAALRTSRTRMSQIPTAH
jgi:hypothetical protein